MDELVKRIVAKYYQNTTENILSILQEIQDEVGYLSAESMESVSRVLGVPVNKIFGLTSFYDDFSFTGCGIYHIRACRGSSCHMQHSSQILKELEKLLKIKPGQTSRDGKFSLQTVCCFGGCHLSPVISVNDRFYTGVNVQTVRKIIDELKGKESHE